MFYANQVIPTRFLTLIAHLCVLINLLWSVQETSTICLPYNMSQSVHRAQQTQLTVGLSVALGLIGFEMLAFISGITMFHSTSSLISISGHASATVLLTYFILDSWQCGWFWWVFTACSVVPALVDGFAVVSTLCANH